jgi:ornithine cyclodeaminase/alanine dehydrogenase-like protein (mu-crystallin family)
MLQPSKILIWARRADAAKRLAGELTERGIAADQAPTAASIAAQARTILCCTAARAPILEASDVRTGTIIVALGADAIGKQELDPDILLQAGRILCDDIDQCLDHGELQHLDHRPDAIETLGSAGAPVAPRPTTVVDLTGIAAQDVAVAQMCLPAIKAVSGPLE